MNALSPFLVVDHSCDETLRRLNRRLPRVGLRVMQTFDLQEARPSIAYCPCPHHGTSECDCQMVVLLIYGSTADPTTLVLHGNNGQTWLSLVSTPEQRADSSIRASIEKALQVNPPEEGL